MSNTDNCTDPFSRVMMRSVFLLKTRSTFGKAHSLYGYDVV